MTYYDQTAGTEDPLSLLDELRRSIALEETSPGSDAGDGGADDQEWWSETLLSNTTFTSPAVVLASVDLVIPPATPRPEARSRMISAAGRALAERRSRRGLLPVLLRSAREEHALSVAEVAQRSGLAELQITDLEIGDQPVNVQLDASVVAQWIRGVPAERQMVIDALRRSLQTGWTGEHSLAAGLGEQPISIETYIERVLVLLGADDQGAAQ